MAHSMAQADLGYLHWSEKEPFFLVDETPHSWVCLQTEGCQGLSLCDQTITRLAETNRCYHCPLGCAQFLFVVS